MIGPVDHVCCWTRDLAAAIAFHRDVVGLPVVRREGDRWDELDAGSLRFAPHATNDAVQTSGTVVSRVEDLEAARWALERRGASFDPHVGEVAGYARFARFRDPGRQRDPDHRISRAP